MLINTICKKCEHEFVLGSDNVKQRTVVHKESNKQYVLTYYHCPECNEEHIVQIDDNSSLELLKETTLMMKEKVIASRAGKNISKKSSKEFKKKRNLLTAYRTELMVKLDNQVFVEEFGIEFEIHFTMSNVEE